MERWEIDSGHSGIWFSIRHMELAKVRGHFSRWSGFMLSEGSDLRNASISILIDVTSISTGLEARDAHLRSKDFLDTENWPELTFLGKVGDEPLGGELRIAGDLTALGRAHPFAFAIENTGRAIDPWGHERASFTARGSLDRNALGISWNQPLGVAGFLVGDQVDFEIEIEAVHQEKQGSDPR